MVQVHPVPGIGKAVQVAAGCLCSCSPELRQQQAEEIERVRRTPPPP